MRKVLWVLLLAALLLSGCQPYTPATVGQTNATTAPSASVPEVTTVPATQYTTTAPVSTKPHVHSYLAEVIAPSCTEGGFTVHVCACGDQFTDTETDALGHDWGDWQTIEAATTEKEGLQQRGCTRCDAIDRQSLPKLQPSHSHEYSEQVVAPGCTKGGYTQHTCSCGDSYRDSFTDALGHSFSAYRSNGDASCTADGTRTASCGRCGADVSEADPGSALGHDWGEWSVTVEPTVEAEGQKNRNCVRCGATDNMPLDRLPAPHEHDYEKQRVAATCTEGGYDLYTCECGDSYREETSEPTGHSWGQWTVTVEPTVTTHGTRSRTCEQCDAAENATVEILPVEGGFVIVAWTETVSRNEDAYVTIWGTPGVEYDIAVFYKSGESSAKGLENKVADENGCVTWTWHVGGRTAAGKFKIVVTDGVHTRTIYFTVEE